MVDVGMGGHIHKNSKLNFTFIKKQHRWFEGKVCIGAATIDRSEHPPISFQCNKNMTIFNFYKKNCTFKPYPNCIGRYPTPLQ